MRPCLSSRLLGATSCGSNDLVRSCSPRVDLQPTASSVNRHQVTTADGHSDRSDWGTSLRFVSFAVCCSVSVQLRAVACTGYGSGSPTAFCLARLSLTGLRRSCSVLHGSLEQFECVFAVCCPRWSFEWAAPRCRHKDARPRARPVVLSKAVSLSQLMGVIRGPCLVDCFCCCFV